MIEDKRISITFSASLKEVAAINKAAASQGMNRSEFILNLFHSWQERQHDINEWLNSISTERNEANGY